MLPVTKENLQIPKYNVSFKIQDGETAIQGAVITLDGKSKTTGSAGGCTFTDIEEGLYEITVEATGYETQTGNIRIDEDHTSITIDYSQLSGGSGSGSGKG